MKEEKNIYEILDSGNTYKEYFEVLSNEIPEFLYDYINTPEMLRLDKISALVGADYTKLFNLRSFYSSLVHSIGVALIIWNFTKDKKQTLSGLFHDIATPAFKHVIDFLNRDYEKQESTEELTTSIIKNSKEIMSLLERDNIKLEEVNDYKIYPIADNDTPKLSADRLEYTFSDAYVLTQVWDVEKIREMYKDIVIMQNEDGIEELGFKTLSIAEEFIDGASKLWYILQGNKDKIKSQFIADVIKSMNNQGLINKEDLYKLTEQEIINRIENCEDIKISEAFKKFRNTSEIEEGENKPENKYGVSLKVKRRYIIPLVNEKRLNDVSVKDKNLIDKFLVYKSPKYGWFEFDFKG